MSCFVCGAETEQRDGHESLCSAGCADRYIAGYLLPLFEIGDLIAGEGSPS